MERTSSFLRQYALSGIKYFKDLPSKDRISKKLGHDVATHDQKVGHWFSEFAKGSTSPILLPTPKPGGDTKAVFFCPKLVEGTLALGLIFCVEHGAEFETIAFRLEPADKPDRAHAYSHWQITRDLNHPKLRTSLSADAHKWIPDSYPAFPARCREPMEMVFAMLAAVHGYSPTDVKKYALGTLANMQNIASDRPRLSKALDEYLNGPQAGA